jgi:hypothetical protein
VESSLICFKLGEGQEFLSQSRMFSDKLCVGRIICWCEGEGQEVT